MSNSVLVNFYIPRSLKHRLEDVCDYRHLTRTSFILTSLEPMIEHWERKIRSHDIPTKSEDHRSEFDPPKFFSSNEGQYGF